MLKHAVLVCLLVIAGQAQAGLIQFDATSAFSGLVSNFSVTYNDVSGDGLLQIGEVVTFSGVSIFGFPFPILVSVPNITGIATGPSNLWSFSGAFPLSLPSQVWGYSGSAIVAVPEPGALALLGVGLIALGLLIQLRRRPHVARIRRAAGLS